MKSETKSFYDTVVRAAVERIVQGLDEALDLGELARGAALSPLHFHHIFRGMVGETPLEMHRRLRLERSAHRLAQSEASVTSIAFDAGYETHESFTRAFGRAYSVAPSEFRSRTREARAQCARPQPFELAAPCGVHFVEGARSSLHLTTMKGSLIMNVSIETMPEMIVAAVRHVGPYNTISQAFAQLGEIAQRAGLHSLAGATMVALYHDDPESTPPAELRSDAAIVVPKGTQLPKELTEIHIPAGRYARTTHLGPYTELGDTWSRLMGQWIPQNGHRIGSSSSYEVYRNTPMTAPPSELKTDLYVPLA